MLLLCSSALYAQNDLIVGQYIHNQFAINPAFAGSRDGLTFFGSWRKQWQGIENTPTSLLFTAHAPLKRENLTLGLQVWNQKIHQSKNSGAAAEIGYRFRTGKLGWMSFALLPGVSIRNTDWTKVHLIDDGDEAFSENEQNINPTLGFGMAWYGRKFFLGVSVTSLFLSDDFDTRKAEFNPADAQYVATGGYLFTIGDIGIQPSAMATYSSKNDIDATGTLTGIWRNFIWVDAAYTTKNEMSFGAAVQALPQLRVAYNYGFVTGDLSKYNNGSHEISIQYDLVYRVKTVAPRFY